ncbi:MAG: 4Fe-4S dicluster domain-containing protein [Thermodesulfobacteriota bacterium]
MRVSTWFRYSLTEDSGQWFPYRRFLSVAGGVLSTLLSPRILTLLRVFVVDVLIQARTFRESFYRWLMHILMYYGFMLLLLMHGFEGLLSERLLPDYQSTLNPYMFLRDLAALMVVAGVAMALYRRLVVKPPRLRSSGRDHYALAILAVIILSGILLEGIKITSSRAFHRMEQDYAGLGDEKEVQALEAYWVRHFGVVSPDLKGPISPEVLEQGREIHEMNCAGCHSSPRWAFTGYLAARVVRPLAIRLDGMGMDRVLWVIHFLACFVGLAFLPFTKMFHVLAGPISILANAVMDGKGSSPSHLAVKRMMELDACTHCGACTTRCAVGPAFELIPNPNILPSEKVASLKAWARTRDRGQEELARLQEGLCLCTNCRRCTDVCPVGIDLQDLWDRVRESVLGKGYPEIFLLSPLSIHRGLRRDGMEERLYRGPVDAARNAVAHRFKVDIQEATLGPALRDPALGGALRLSAQGRTFSHCYNCQTCTSACPVVHNYDNPQKELGMVPHQIMQAAAHGLKDLILGSKMLWACLGCYRCQEQCPQGVRVTDVFYELKTLAVAQVKRAQHGVGATKSKTQAKRI